MRTLLKIPLGIALLSLAIMAAIVYFNLQSQVGPAAHAIELEGKKFRFVLGRGEIADSLLVVNQFVNGAAVLSYYTDKLSAKDFALLKYQSPDGSAGNVSAAFFWRAGSNPRDTPRIYLSNETRGFIELDRVPAWDGEIKEIGLVVFGQPGDELRLADIQLVSRSLSDQWTLMWRKWVQFEPWSQRSINFLSGGFDGQWMSLTALIMAWVLLSCFMYAGYLVKSKQSFNLLVPFILIIIGWVALDIKWSLNLTKQAQATIATYNGKTQDQKLTDDPAGILFTLAETLKKKHLPSKPARIVLLKDSVPNDYFRLRAQYYLAPHNVYNRDRLPRKRMKNSQNYLLQLGDIDGLSYKGVSGQLRWGDHQSLLVEELYSSTQGKLFLLE